MNTKMKITLLIVIPLLAGWLTLTVGPPAGPGEQVREAAVAGAFYPKDPKELAAMVDGFLSQASVPAQKGQIIALVAPHAGYPFSGGVAAHSYALLKGRPTHRVVVIAPSHFDAFPFASVYEGDTYTTPLGKISVDKEFARKLAGASPEIKLSSRGHVPSQQGAEHALEVQLPFLQSLVPQFTFVPIPVGVGSYQPLVQLGEALGTTLSGERDEVLIIASSDMNHYENDAATRKKDARAIERILALDTEGL